MPWETKILPKKVKQDGGKFWTVPKTVFTFEHFWVHFDTQ